MKLPVIRQNEKDENTKCVHLYLCVCVLCIFVYSPAKSHPATYQSSPLSLYVCIDLAFAILKEMSLLSPVKQILWLQQKRQTTGESREAQGYKVILKICRPSSPIY